MSQNPTGSAHLPTLLDPALSQGLLQGTILDSAVLSTPPGRVCALQEQLSLWSLWPVSRIRA